MPPPAAFYTIGSFPYSQLVTQADFNAGTHGGAANEVWFKYTPALNHVLGFFCNKGGTNNPRMFFYQTSSLTLIKQFDGAFAWWRVVTSGVDYWIKIVDIGGTSPSDFDFTVQANTAVLNPALTPGDIIINDDTTYSGSSSNRIPSTVLSPTGSLIGFKDGPPAGEVGDSVESGYQLWHDRLGVYPSRLVLFDPDGTFVASVDTSPTISATFPNIVGHSSGKFYVISRAISPINYGKIYTVTTAGVVSSLIADMGTRPSAVGISNDETIAYWATTGFAAGDPTARAIHRYDLVNDVPLSDLYAVPELATDQGLIAATAINEHPAEILVLNDDSIVTFYHNYDIGKSVLLHLDPSGTVLHSYTYSWASDLKAIDHISWDPDSPSYIRIWFFEGTNDDVGHIGRLTLSTGALTTFPVKLFSAGVNLTVNDPTMFGPSSSCTMVTAKRSAALEDSTDTGDGGTDTIPTCCDEGGPPGGGDTGVNPDPVGILPPWMASCTGGGLVDGVADLADGESWL